MSVFDIYRPRLHDISLKYNTDKSWSKYTYIYDNYFHNQRDKPMRILEIGIAGGGSLRMWEEYFPNAKIYGVDINPDCRSLASDRTKIFIGDASDIEFFKREVFPVTGTEFDMIIDDGSHRNDHIIITMNNLFPYVVFGGYYVVEDFLVTAFPNSEWYAPYQGYETFFDYVSYIQKEINVHSLKDGVYEIGDERALFPPVITPPDGKDVDCSIWRQGAYSVSMYLNICFIEKQNRYRQKPLESAFFDRVVQEAKSGLLDESVYKIVSDLVGQSGNALFLKILTDAWDSGKNRDEQTSKPKNNKRK